MHDDRIEGVTFEENALRNALIVNEEYAWVGNPFSAPKQQGGPQWFSLLLWVLSCGFVPGGLKMPLSGAGEGSDSESESGGGRPVRTLPSDEKPYNATASRSVIREAGRSILYPEPFITSRTGRPDQYPGVCTMSGLGFDSNSLVGIGMA